MLGRLLAGVAILQLIGQSTVAAEDGRAINGRVVDFSTQRPLVGRTVAVGALRAVTDAEGRFSLAGVPPTYDVILVEPDRTTVTVYRRLQRRDPLLTANLHRENRWKPQHYATVRGTLAGGGPYPTAYPDYATVYLFSEQQSMDRPLLPPEPLGPDFRPLSVGWDGVLSVKGLLVALRRVPEVPPVARKKGEHETKAKPAFSTWIGHRELALTYRETTVDLVLSRPPVKHLSGSSNADFTWALYHLPFPGAVLPLTAPGQQQAAAFDFVVPDLHALGGQYCVQADFRSSDSSTVRCGIPLGAKQVALKVEPPPRLNPPDETAAPEMSFSWSGDPWAVYLLEIDVQFPTPTNPSIYIYTTETSTKWPDLAPVGIRFPIGAASYACRVRGLGPYADLDEAVGPDGLGAMIPKEMRRSVSQSFSFIVEPSARAAVTTKRAANAGGSCDVPYGSAIVCNQWTNVDDREMYVLSAINMKLKHYPQFAAAIGMSCVRDCASARKFAAAYARYRTDHPGFDANEPREP